MASFGWLRGVRRRLKLFMKKRFFVFLRSGLHLLKLDGFNLDLNTVRCLSSKENYLKKKSRRSRDSNMGLLGGEQERFLCATQPPSSEVELRNAMTWVLIRRGIILRNEVKCEWLLGSYL